MKYTPEQLQFLKEQYRVLLLDELTAAFNSKYGASKTRTEIHSTLKNHEFTCGRRSGEANLGKYKILNPAQVEFLRKHYPTMSRREITAAINQEFGLSLKLSQIIAFVKNNGIKSGRTGHFVPGQTSHNAGTKGLMKANSGSFKKGQTPDNRLPVGTVIVDSYGYKKIKVADPSEWEFVHRHQWEQAHGPIPAGHAVVFADGDKNNTALDNLECIPRAELGVRNKFAYGDVAEKLKPIAKTLVKLRIKTGELRRRKKSARAA
ncbi:MAG: HNH endonuclease signature motif containing protein [Gammaproteobacteria bacterium]|nr:HNH endonuclease signature motif containing protein [Gammaproteobacteria bacterium]